MRSNLDIEMLKGSEGFGFLFEILQPIAKDIDSIRIYQDIDEEHSIGTVLIRVGNTNVVLHVINRINEVSLNAWKAAALKITKDINSNEFVGYISVLGKAIKLDALVGSTSREIFKKVQALTPNYSVTVVDSGSIIAHALIILSKAIMRDVSIKRHKYKTEKGKFENVRTAIFDYLK